jgi:phosphoglycerate dehydrogenase-like enzyme
MTTRRKIIATDMEIAQELGGPVREFGRRGFEIRKLDAIEKGERGDVEVLLIRSSGLVNPSLFETFPKAKLLQSMSAGVDFINIASIPQSVTLCSNAGAYKEPIAEHVFAMLLFFTKNLARNHNRLREGRFDNSPDSTFLAGRTMGVIGAGGIGQSTARIAKAFNMKTIGINSSGKSVPGFDEVWSMKHLDRLLKQSDFVLLSLPLNVHTRNLIDAKRLSEMKDDAVLVNVARGPIISQADLYAHLKAHPNFRAGIDVWWNYPKDGEKFSLDYPFFELPNFISSPHIADGVPESTGHGQKRAFENILRYVRKQPLERIIDKSDYKGFTGAHH